MTDPWTELASLLATVIEKYGAAILSEDQQEKEKPEDARTFVNETDF